MDENRIQKAFERIKNQIEKAVEHMEKMKNYEGKPAQRGFVYRQPHQYKVWNGEEIYTEADYDDPLLHLVLHNHPDDPDLFFVVPIFEKWWLEKEHSEMYEFHEPAIIAIPGEKELVLCFNGGDWVDRSEIETWFLADVYDREKWLPPYREWREKIFGKST